MQQPVMFLEEMMICDVNRNSTSELQLLVYNLVSLGRDSTVLPRMAPSLIQLIQQISSNT